MSLMLFTITFLPSGDKLRGVGNTLEDAINLAKRDANTVRAGTERFEIESNDGLVQKAWRRDGSEWVEISRA